MKTPVTIIAAICCLLSFSAKAQFTEVELGVNGLTCSQCCRNVELSIRKLDFVMDVAMNTEHTDGKISFFPNKKVDIEKIAKAVNNAGFSVRSLTAKFSFAHTDATPESCFNYNGDMYEFVQTKPQTLDGTATIKFIGKKFLSKKEFRNWQSSLQKKCGDNGKGKYYYVTIPEKTPS